MPSSNRLVDHPGDWILTTRMLDSARLTNLVTEVATSAEWYNATNEKQIQRFDHHPVELWICLLSHVWLLRSFCEFFLKVFMQYSPAIELAHSLKPTNLQLLQKSQLFCKIIFSGNPPPTKIKILNKKTAKTRLSTMNPHPVRSQDSLPVPEKNPSTLGTLRTHGLLTPGRTTTSRHSRNQSFAGWPPAPVWTVEFVEVAFRQIFWRSETRLRGSFWMKNWRPCSFFWSLGGRWKDEILATSRACKRDSSFLIYMHCAWHCRSYTCTHFCKQKRGGDVWVKCRNNCSQGHVTLSILDTIVLPRYVGSSCSSLKCVNFAPWRNCT